MFDHLDKGRWWDVGLQIVEGCTKVSPGCDNCWSLTAANMRRFNPNAKTRERYKGTVHRAMIPGAMMRPEWTGGISPQWQDLDKIGRSRTPKVYTFWNDLFHPGVEEEFITSAMLRMLNRPQHFYIICTKRPERALEYFRMCFADFCGLDPDNRERFRRLMLMTTAENQEMADLRIPALLQIPGVLHGVSVEPGLSLINFRWAKWAAITEGVNTEYDGLRGLDWVICGGETGPYARPMHPDIPRKLRDDCQAAGVPFFFKSWGEWKSQLSLTQEEYDDFWTYPGKQRNKWGTIDIGGNWFPMATPWNGRQGDDSPEREFVMLRVGKRTAGRLLDSRTWDAAAPWGGRI